MLISQASESTSFIFIVYFGTMVYNTVLGRTTCTIQSFTTHPSLKCLCSFKSLIPFFSCGALLLKTSSQFLLPLNIWRQQGVGLHSGPPIKRNFTALYCWRKSCTLGNSSETGESLLFMVRLVTISRSYQ